MITSKKNRTNHGDDYKTSCMLEHNYLIKHYKMIAIDLST